MSTNLHSSLSSERNTLLTSSIPYRNELLKDFLSVPAIASDLLPHSRVITFSVNQVLCEQGDEIDMVYFPIDCVVSSLAIMEDGTTIETAMVGREGMVGISNLLGSGPSREWIWVTAGGAAIQIETKYLDSLFVRNETALKLLLKSYRALITQVSQRCVCNTRHTILERLSCWLLMLHDRVSSGNLNLTQETIASRIGARRAGITVAAGTLQEMNAIGYRRGQLHIQDRQVLESMACECYNIMRNRTRPTPPQFLCFLP